jgi:hypothetical protein
LFQKHQGKTAAGEIFGILVTSKIKKGHEIFENFGFFNDFMINFGNL